MFFGSGGGGGFPFGDFGKHDPFLLNFLTQFLDDFMGGRGGMRGQKEEKEIDNNRFYELLGVKKEST